MSWALEFIVILALTLLNGVFSAAEIAVIAVRATRVQELAERGPAGKRLAELRADPERLLATVQIAITVVGASAGAFGGATWANDTSRWLSGWGVPSPWAENLALVLVVGLISFATLVIGELVPKSLALKWSEPYALLVARPLHRMSRAAGPLVWLLTASSNLVLRAFGDRTNFVEAEISREELLAVLHRATDGGEISSHAAGIAARAIALDTLHLRAVMTPRAALAPIAPDADAAELEALLAETDHERFLVGEDPDRLVGFVTSRDVARHLAASSSGSLATFARQLPSVHRSRLTLPVLEELQRAGAPMAAVVDDEGGLEGVVDVDDLATEIVGALVGVGGAEVDVVHEHGRVFVVAGSVRLHRINHLFGLDLPTGPRWTTVGGLLAAKLGRSPGVGDRVEGSDRWLLEALEVDAGRVLRVRISPRPTDDA